MADNRRKFLQITGASLGVLAAHSSGALAAGAAKTRREETGGEPVRARPRWS